MEDLIWKYVDGECSPEEKIQVEQALESNVVFREMYQTILFVDNSLKVENQSEMSTQFKTALSAKLTDVLSEEKAVSIQLISVKEIMLLLAFAILAIALCFNSVSEQGVLLQMPVLDNKVGQMIAWVSFSFAILWTVDTVIGKIGARGQKILSFI